MSALLCPFPSSPDRPAHPLHHRAHVRALTRAGADDASKEHATGLLGRALAPGAFMLRAGEVAARSAVHALNTTTWTRRSTHEMSERKHHTTTAGKISSGGRRVGTDAAACGRGGGTNHTLQVVGARTVAAADEIAAQLAQVTPVLVDVLRKRKGAERIRGAEVEQRQMSIKSPFALCTR